MTPKAKRILRTERTCLARWWSGKYIRACNDEAAPDHHRCEAHQPDGSRLDRDGMPMRNHAALATGRERR